MLQMGVGGGNARTGGHTGLQSQVMILDVVGTRVQMVTWVQSQAMMPDGVGMPHTDSHMGLQSQVMIPDRVGMPV